MFMMGMGEGKAESVLIGFKRKKLEALLLLAG